MSDTAARRLPLVGVKVIDFGHYLAGPAVAMLLADLGATVIRIDPPAGPRWNSPANAVLNRNKACLSLDLKSAQGRQHARALIAAADVVVENFRPGVMARLGLDLAELRARHPQLITLSLPGFASNDPVRRGWRAFEPIIAAASGVFSDMGQNRVLMGVNPSFSALPLASSYASVLGACAVVLALQARLRCGVGEHIEVPLAAALIEGLAYNSIQIEGYPERYKTLREKEIERRRTQGLAMDLSWQDLQEYLDPFYRSYDCADGRKFYVVCPSHRAHAKRCLQTLGLLEEMRAAGLPHIADPYLPMHQWQGDASLGVYPLPAHWAARIAARMKAVMRSKTAGEWETIFGAGGFPGAAHRSTREWLHDAHVQTAALVLDVEHPVYGRMRQPGPVVWLEDCAEPMLHPRAGYRVTPEQALALLAEHSTELPPPGQPQAWLEGVRVLDLTNVIAGPHSTCFLARFGAEVIKLDPAEPNYDPWNTVVFGLSSGRGKRSLLADVRTPAGREVLARLVRSVDVVVMNAPDRQLAPLGLDAASLQALNAEVVFCQLDCFGGPRPGPHSDWLGYDDLIQAASGIMLRFGGGMQSPEEHAHVGTIDVMCGFAAALGIAAALYRKQQGGQAGRARTSLAALGNWVQLPFCYDYPGRPPFDEPSGPAAMGYGALSRFYRCADGWIYLHSNTVELPRLAQVAGLEGLQDARDLADFLQQRFATAPCATWLAALRAADLAAAEVDNIDRLRQTYSRPADGLPGTDGGSYAFSTWANHPSGHCVTQVDPLAIRTAHAPIRALPCAEKFGASSRAVLRQLAYGDAEIDALIAQRVVSESWSDEYLPS